MPNESGSPCIALYTHDTFGLGHVQRCSRIMSAISALDPESSLLLITGAPSLHVLGSLPKNADYVKIPTLARTGNPESRPPHLPLEVRRITEIRQRIVKETLLAYQPDVFLVDNFPLGARRELLPVLRALRETPTKIMLGLRDILDHPELVRADWTEQKLYQLMDELYDYVLVYGMQEIFDIADAYEMPPSNSQKVKYCGYGVPPVRPSLTKEQARADLGVDGKFILATVGGGGDGMPLLETFLKAKSRIPDVPAVVLTGPLMGGPDREAVHRLAEGVPGIIFQDYLKDLPSYMAVADVVVSMGGYNTSAEIVAVEANAIIVPRTWEYGQHLNREQVREEGEQIIRAKALTKLGIVDMLEPQELDARHLAKKIKSALKHPRGKSSMPVNTQGIQNAAKFVLEQAQERGHD
ncbi:MAG: glycosyltransferase family protein [Dehalococcoidia bacterium]